MNLATILLFSFSLLMSLKFLGIKLKRKLFFNYFWNISRVFIVLRRRSVVSGGSGGGLGGWSPAPNWDIKNRKIVPAAYNQNKHRKSRPLYCRLPTDRIENIMLLRFFFLQLILNRILLNNKFQNCINSLNLIKRTFLKNFSAILPIVNFEPTE